MSLLVLHLLLTLIQVGIDYISAALDIATEQAASFRIVQVYWSNSTWDTDACLAGWIGHWGLGLGCCGEYFLHFFKRGMSTVDVCTKVNGFHLQVAPLLSSVRRSARKIRRAGERESGPFR